MKQPTFDSDGNDATTFAPFILRNALDTEWKDIRLEFSDWDWIHSRYGDSIDDYYLNGPGVQGLVFATRMVNGLEPISDTMDPNSEGDTCYIHFTSMDEVVQTADLCAKMIISDEAIRSTAKVSEENDFYDF